MTDVAPVLLDTDAWSRLFAGRRNPTPELSTWLSLLAGRPVLISAQTRGELEFGARAAGWGASRLAAYRRVLDSYPVIYPTGDIVEAWAALRAECKNAGHALHHKAHMGDAWVAATSRALQLPLLSADAIYRDAPGVDLLAGAS